MRSIGDLGTLPVAQGVLLTNLATIQPGTTVGEYDRYNMQRMVTISANIHGRIWATSRQRSTPWQASRRPRGDGRPPGQVPPLKSMMDGLRRGLGLAVAVVLLLLASQLQSWRLASTVIATVPAVLARRRCWVCWERAPRSTYNRSSAPSWRSAWRSPMPFCS